MHHSPTHGSLATHDAATRGQLDELSRVIDRITALTTLAAAA